MPLFAYTARDRSGQTAQGTLDAPSRKDALRLLASRGLSPQSLAETTAAKAATAKKKPAGSASAPKKKQESRAKNPKAAASSVRLARKHRLPFLTSLYELTTSGLSAGEAVRLLSMRVKEPALQTLCAGIWDRVGEGATLSRAMGDFPEVFDDATLNLIEAGEATGNLNDVLARLISHLGEQKELQRQLAAALAYPLFLTFVAAGVVLFFLFFLLPRLETLFTALRGELPLATKILIGFSHFALNYGVFIAIGAVLGAISFWQWHKTEAGRLTTDETLLKLPLVGPFCTAQTVLAFSQTLSVLMENGITTAEALRMTERQIQNRVHRAAFHEATDRVLEGETLSQALIRTGCFPDLVLDQLSIGENTGNIISSLKKISVTFRRLVSDQLNLFTKVIGSGVLLTVFVFVGFIAFAIVSAVFQLSASIQA